VKFAELERKYQPKRMKMRMKGKLSERQLEVIYNAGEAEATYCAPVYMIS